MLKIEIIDDDRGEWFICGKCRLDLGLLSSAKEKADVRSRLRE